MREAHLSKVTIFAAIFLLLSACTKPKSEVEKAVESYEGLKDKLSAEERCTKLSEIANLYYNDNDKDNFNKWTFQKEQNCRIAQDFKDLHNSINDLNNSF